MDNKNNKDENSKNTITTTSNILKDNKNSDSANLNKIVNSRDPLFFNRIDLIYNKMKDKENQKSNNSNEHTPTGKFFASSSQINPRRLSGNNANNIKDNSTNTNCINNNIKDTSISENIGLNKNMSSTNRKLSATRSLLKRHSSYVKKQAKKMKKLQINTINKASMLKFITDMSNEKHSHNLFRKDCYEINNNYIMMILWFISSTTKLIKSVKQDSVKILIKTCSMMCLNEIELMYFSIAFEKAKIPILFQSDDIKSNFDMLAYSIKKIMNSPDQVSSFHDKLNVKYENNFDDLFEAWLENESEFSFCSVSIRELNNKWALYEKYKNSFNAYCKKDKIDYNHLVDKLINNSGNSLLELSLIEN